MLEIFYGAVMSCAKSSVQQASERLLIFLYENRITQTVLYFLTENAVLWRASITPQCNFLYKFQRKRLIIRKLYCTLAGLIRL